MKKTKRSWIEIFITIINYKDDREHLYKSWASFGSLIGTLLKVDDKRVDRALIVNKVHAFGIIFYLEEVTADFTHYFLFYYSLVNILFIFGIFLYLLNFLYVKFKNVINFNLLFFVITPFVIPIFYFIIFLRNFFIIIKNFFNNYILLDIYYDYFIYFSYFLYTLLFILFFIIFYLWIKMFYNYFNNIIIAYNSTGMNNGVYPELDPPNNPKNRIKELLTCVVNRLDEYKYYIIGSVVIVGGITYICKQLTSNATIDSELLKNVDNNVIFKHFQSFRNKNQLFKSGIHKHILINDFSFRGKLKRWKLIIEEREKFQNGIEYIIEEREKFKIVIGPIMKEEKSKIVIQEPFIDNYSEKKIEDRYKDVTNLITELILKNEKLNNGKNYDYILRIFHFLKFKYTYQHGLILDNEKLVLNLCWDDEFIKRYNTMFSDYIYIYKELDSTDFLKFDIMLSKISAKNLKFNTLMQTSKIDNIDALREKYFDFREFNFKNNFINSFKHFTNIRKYLKIIQFDRSLFDVKIYDLCYFETVRRLLDENANILSAPIEEKALWGILLEDESIKSRYINNGINFFIEKNENSFKRSMMETLIENKTDPLLKGCNALFINDSKFLEIFYKKKLVYFSSEHRIRYVYRHLYLDFMRLMLLSNDFNDSVKLKHLKNLKYVCSVNINFFGTKETEVNDIDSLYNYLNGLLNKEEIKLEKRGIQELLLQIKVWNQIRTDFMKQLDQLIQIFEEKNNFHDALNNEIQKSGNEEFEFLKSNNVIRYIFACNNETSQKIINLLFLNEQELICYTTIDNIISSPIYISFDRKL
jgi:hypothetical protein